MAVTIAMLGESCGNAGYATKLVGSQSAVLIDPNIKVSWRYLESIDEEPGYNPFSADTDRMLTQIAHKEYDAVLVSHLHRDHSEMLVDCLSKARVWRQRPRTDTEGGGLYGFVKNGRLNWLDVTPSVGRRQQLQPIEEYQLHGNDKIVRIRSPHNSYQGPAMQHVYMNGFLVELDGIRTFYTGDIHGQATPAYIKTLRRMKPNVLIMDGVNVDQSSITALQRARRTTRKILKGIKSLEYVVVDHHACRSDRQATEALHDMKRIAAEPDVNFRGEIKRVADFPKTDGSFRGFTIT